MFLVPLTHFSGETHWFPSLSGGVEVPVELHELVNAHVRSHGWNESIVEDKDTGIVATQGYEALIPLCQDSIPSAGSCYT